VAGGGEKARFCEHGGFRRQFLAEQFGGGIRTFSVRLR
jgi:hypothetical protein